MSVPINEIETIESVRYSVLEHERDLLDNIYMNEELNFLPIVEKCKRLERERDLLLEILENRDTSVATCSCGGRAYYYDHYDDDKVHCTECRKSTCVKCIGNHCNYCDNRYNIICKKCTSLEAETQSRWCPECKTLCCQKCWSTVECATCYKVYPSDMCPGCFIQKSPDLIHECYCGMTICPNCECLGLPHIKEKMSMHGTKYAGKASRKYSWGQRRCDPSG